MESVGERLKKVRLGKGISLEEVHKKTKIHLNILEAIEEDSLVNLSLVYVKGFLKIYCKFLGLDFRDYIADYKEPQRIVTPSPQPKEKSAAILPVVYASLKLTSLKLGPIKKILIPLLIIIVISVGLFNLGRIIHVRHKASKAVPAPEVLDKAEKKKLTTQPLQPKVVPSIIRLGIRARNDCWIQLKADGRVIFQSILKKGRSENWQANDRIELALGNAGAVDLEVNGKLIPPLGKKGQSLKNIMITKEGLSVGR